MTRDELVAYCLAKPGAYADEPWEGDEVAKVGGKIFAFLGGGGPGGFGVGVKCGRTAEQAGEIRDRYPTAVTKSAYVGRYGWNSVTIDGTIPDDEIEELVDMSYDFAVAALPKSQRPT